MKKITLLFLLTSLVTSVEAQIVAWSSDLEDLTGWGIQDADSDGNNWEFFSGGADSFGFTGAFGLSASWIPDPAPNGTALTPDNILFTPTFTIPGEAVTISFKMKVASTNSTFFAENYAVYVYDDAIGPSIDTNIFEETLTSGGAGTAKDITATIPVSFAGKTLGILIRHYDCTDELELLVDDFEVSYNTSLSIKDNLLDISGIYPNPVKDEINIKTDEIVDGISIINQLGQRIMEFKANNIVNNKVNLSNLNKGIYIMTITAQNKAQSIKIIKE